MIETAAAAFLVASESKRCLAVRAEFAEQTELSLAVAERHEFFAEQLEAHRRAIAPCNLFGQKRGHPMTPHQASHRRIALDLAQQLVFRRRQHAFSPNKILSFLSIIQGGLSRPELQLTLPCSRSKEEPREKLRIAARSLRMPAAMEGQAAGHGLP